MTTTTHTHLLAGVGSLPGIGDLLWRWLDGLRRQREARMARAELQRLPDHLLWDIGIERDRIPEVVGLLSDSGALAGSTRALDRTPRVQTVTGGRCPAV